MNRSVSESERSEPRERSESVVSGKRTKLVRRSDKKRRSGGARSVKSEAKRKRSVGERSGSELTKRGKKNGCGSKRNEKSTNGLEKPASRRFERKTLNELAAYKRSSTETEEGAIAGVGLVVGLRIVTGTVVVETAAGGEAAVVGPDHGSVSKVSSLKTSKSTTIWLCSFYCKKANR